MFYTQDNPLDRASRLVTHCEHTGTNLCGNFENWTRVAMALSTLGEDARPLFHRLASMDLRYRYGESDRKFTQCMRTTRRTTIATLYYIAKQAGVDFRCLDDNHPTPASAPNVSRKQVHKEVLRRLPIDLIKRSEGMANNLARYLATIFPPQVLATAMKAYRMGSTRSGATIFPMLDASGMCRSGKVVMYDPQTGHRIRDRDKAGATWLHTLWLKQRNWDCEFELEQCLFGEHLLAERPGTVVGIVEAEKTALICSMINPVMVWVATGGIQGFTAQRLRPLAGRQAIVFCDADAIELWVQRKREIQWASKWTISQWHTTEPPGSHRDIADLLLDHLIAHPHYLNTLVAPVASVPGTVTPQQVFDDMKSRSPAFAQFAREWQFSVM